MSRRCDLSGKGVQSGNRVSHSKVRTRHRFLPNIQKKRFWSTDLGKFITLRVTAAAMRTVDKLGLDVYAKRQGLKL